MHGKVVTRFPPEPSGYLHIGHAKAAMLNYYFGKEMYGGKFIVRFDDTNPTKERDEFEQTILEDLEMMGIRGDVITHTSDHFQKLYDYAVEIIKRGKAYCDDTEQADVCTPPEAPFCHAHIMSRCAHSAWTALHPSGATLPSRRTSRASLR